MPPDSEILLFVAGFLAGAEVLMRNPLKFCDLSTVPCTVN